VPAAGRWAGINWNSVWVKAAIGALVGAAVGAVMYVLRRKALA